MNNKMPPHLKYYLKIGIYPFVSTILMLIDDFLHQFFIPANQAELEIEYVAVLFVLNLALWASGSFLFTAIILCLFLVMQIMQISYITMTGHPLTPFDLTRMGTEQYEVLKAAAHATPLEWLSLLSVILPYALLFWIFKKYLRPQESVIKVISIIVVVLILGSKFERATRKNMLAFMPGPTRSSLHNSINAFSFAIVSSTLKADQAIAFPKYKPYSISEIPNARQSQNIIVLVADSLRTDRLSLFGYDENTTPNLNELARSGQLTMAQGVSSSVATGASIPLFLNVISEPGNIVELEKKTANLFRAAQKHGYKTHWLSTQESKMLNGISSQNIDNIKTIEDAQLDYSIKGEKVIHEWADEINWQEKNFVFILMRIVHSPYYEAYDQDKKFNSTAKLTKQQTYDQAVRYYDDFIKDFYKNLSLKADNNFLMLLTSDHGQLLGEHGYWGHNRLMTEVNHVPVMLLQDNRFQNVNLPDTYVMSHYETGAWLLSLMGYKLNNPNYIPDVHYYQGEKIYSDNAFKVIYEHDSFLQYCSVQMVSDIDTRHMTDQCQKDQDKISPPLVSKLDL